MGSIILNGQNLGGLFAGSFSCEHGKFKKEPMVVFFALLMRKRFDGGEHLHLCGSCYSESSVGKELFQLGEIYIPKVKP